MYSSGLKFAIFFDKPITRNEFVKMIVSAFDIEMTDAETKILDDYLLKTVL